MRVGDHPEQDDTAPRAADNRDLGQWLQPAVPHRTREVVQRDQEDGQAELDEQSDQAAMPEPRPERGLRL